MSVISRHILIILSCIFSWTVAYAQQVDLESYSNEQLGSIYYAYPQPTGKLSPAPKGYEPFYISHYGRHGSRWITSDDRYRKVIDIFENNELTPLGENVKIRLLEVWNDAQGRGGDLTPLGERQHKSIAERMYSEYPQVFGGNTTISARSSIVLRCVMSMSAFSERLKELNPKLNIIREANQRYMNYLAYTTPEAEEFVSSDSLWIKDFKQFESEHIRPDRLSASLFKNPNAISDPKELMMGLYWIASDMQNTELPLSFYDIFEKQELFDIWQSINYRMYVCNACAPINGGIMPQSAGSLLRNIMESADQAIDAGNPSATLRFGHDTYFIRLLALMKLEGCCDSETDGQSYYKVWQDFQVSPMAGNLQIIFYRNSAKNVIVKFLLNENEVALPVESNIFPYYKWEDVKLLYSEYM